MLQHLHRIVTDHAQVGDARFLGGAEAGPHARGVHLDADEVLLGGILGHLHQGGAHAEAYFQHHRGLAAKQRHHVQRRRCEIDAHDRPELFQSLLLPFGQAAFATDEAADLAHELAVFVKYILGHRHNCLVISSIRVTEPGAIRVKGDLGGSLFHQSAKTGERIIPR
ncbi:hypothetical protein D3C79_807490 [compost metagenome]